MKDIGIVRGSAAQAVPLVIGIMLLMRVLSVCM